MKQEDLRLGNLVNYRDKSYILTVSSLGENGFETKNERGLLYGSDDVNEYSGIELTEEWLLKLGFEKEVINTYYLTKTYYYINDFEVEFHGKKLVFRVNEENMTRYFAHHTKYIHQLQNLYFALTGEELTIK